MASTMRAVMVMIEQAVIETSPPAPVALLFERAIGTGPLELQPAVTRSRQFAVEALDIDEGGDFVGPCREIWHSFNVPIRYAVDKRNVEQWRETQQMAASDAGRVYHQIMQPVGNASWNDGGILNLRFKGHDHMRPTEVDGMWIQYLQFSALYADDSALP